MLLVCQNQGLNLFIYLLAHRKLRDLPTSPPTATPGHLDLSFYLNTRTLIAIIFQNLIRVGLYNRLLVVDDLRIYIVLNLT